MHIDHNAVTALERGVTLLGSGGGGDSATMAELMRFRLRSRRELSVTPVSELPDDATVVPVGMVGATSALTEKLPSGREFADAVSAIERWTGTSADAVVSIEIGGTNGLLGLVAADELGLPCVDADLCGRALSRLDQFSLVAAGRELGPVALSDPRGQLVVLDRSAPARIERTVRALITLGGWGMLALAPVLASELTHCAVLGTVSAALRLGELALSLSPPDLAEAVGGRLLGEGRVVEVARRLEPGRHDDPGFGRGSATVQATAGGLVRLEMENEYLLALCDGVVVATTPDLLVVLDKRTGVPIPCDRLRQGMEVGVLQLPAPEFWRDPRRGAAVWPRAYGIDCDPVLLAGAP
ncbi:DUF917 domain-containing protein [Pseudonocardia spinosispora]|uniref:DUF917 domain-containing protein n=1 Tax=Pseudonocardia spinosispora TaxID=103441 RepID=UPI00042552FC|nr:DUF917 domain-containing protein [Pseudonocardia spinosispora]